MVFIFVPSVLQGWLYRARLASISLAGRKKGVTSLTLIVESLRKTKERLSAASIPWAIFAGAAAFFYGAKWPIIDIDVLIRHPFLLSGIAAFLAGWASLGMEEARTTEPEPRFFRVILRLLRSMAFLLLCMAGFLAELGYASFNIAIPLAGKRLGLSPSQIRIVLSLYSLSFTLLQVPVGVYAERTGKRRLLVGASFLSALLFLGLYLAEGFL